MNTEKNKKEKLAIGGALAGGLMFFGFLTQAPLDGLSERNKAGVNTALPNVDTKGKRTSTFQQDRYEALQAKYKKLDKKYSEDRYAASAEIGKINNSYEKALSEIALQKENLAGLKKKNEDLAAISKNDGAMGASQVADLKAENKVLRAKLQEVGTTLKEKFGVSSIDEASAVVGDLLNRNKKLKRQLDDEKFILERQNQSLKAQVNQFRAAKNVFVESVDLLPKNAQGLLADLKTLEGKKPEEVEKAYQDIAKKHCAVSKVTISFASGSSETTPKIVAAIKEAATKADSKAYFFVVGYADKTGDPASNQKLSSARATVTAKELAKSSKGFQAAQAYYLGQTDRFGAKDKNRIVEIWVLE